MLTLAAALLLAAVTPSPSPSPSPNHLQAIGTVTVVSGSAQSLHRSPQAASVLDAPALRRSTAPSLDAALRMLPGVDRSRSNAPFTNYGQLRLSFAGAGADRGALFVDGVPAQDGFGGQVDWNAYPANSVVRAELLRGPGSALYGSGAIGGVLSLSTRAPAVTPGGTLSTEFGGVDRGSTELALSGAIGSLATSLDLASRRLGYDVIPPSAHSPVDRSARSQADAAHVRLRHATASGALDLDLLAAQDGQEDGRPNNGFSRSLRQAGAAWSRASFTLSAFTRATRVLNLADRYPTLPGALLYTQSVPSSDAGLNARFDAALHGGSLSIIGSRRLVTGASRQYAADGTVQSDTAGTQTLDGLALQRVWEGRLAAIAGARLDDVRTQAAGRHDASAVSPRVALRYDASHALALRAAYGTGLRAPFLNELVRSYRIGTVAYTSNAALVPERSRSAQAGFDVAAGSGRFALDYTLTRVADAIGFRTVSTTLQQRANLGRTATDALTAEYTRTGACTAQRAFVEAQHDRVTSGTAPQLGKRLAYVPDTAASLSAERTVGMLTGALEVSYSGPTFADDLERQPLGNTVLVGGRVAVRRADGAELSLAVDNLADARYLTSVDRVAPPSSVTLRLSLPLGRATAAPAVCRRP